MPSPRIALVTERRYVDQPITDTNWYLKNIFHEDHLLSEALARHGYQAERVDWSDPEVDWSSYRASIIRTTWDYFDRYHEFSEWLDERKSDSVLFNPIDQLRWNMDKHYLDDLERLGISIVPTMFIEQGSDFSSLDIRSKWQCDEAVLKPCISGAARHTYRLAVDDHSSWNRLLGELVPEESMMIQPFQQRILEEGETTLVLFNGRVTHAVRKVAKAGDFRVQDDHGGTVYPHQASPEEIEFAESAIAACSPTPIYGRADLVRGQDGRLQIMELELVEPELWMRFAPSSANRFAEAIHLALL